MDRQEEGQERQERDETRRNEMYRFRLKGRMEESVKRVSSGSRWRVETLEMVLIKCKSVVLSSPCEK